MKTGSGSEKLEVINKFLSPVSAPLSSLYHFLRKISYSLERTNVLKILYKTKSICYNLNCFCDAESIMVLLLLFYLEKWDQ